MRVIRFFNAQPVKIPHFKSPLTRKQARRPMIFYCIFLMFISWMLIKPSFKKGLIVEQFQRNYLKIQPNTKDNSTRLCGINPTNSVVIPQSLVLRSIVSSWISTYKICVLCQKGIYVVSRLYPASGVSEVISQAQQTVFDHISKHQE